jgi:hypothetical protein
MTTELQKLPPLPYVRYLDIYGQFQQNCLFEYGGHVFDCRTVLDTFVPVSDEQVVLDLNYKPISLSAEQAEELSLLRHSTLKVALTKYHLAYSNVTHRNPDGLSE